MPKLLHLIVACAENRVMGRGGRLPWRIPEDTTFFHDQTAGQIVVLGRVCYETWPRVALDGRRPIVITRNRSLANDRVRVAASLADALTIAETLPGDIYICGGARIYAETLALDRPMRLHLTLVHADVEGDTFFPEWRHLTWREITRRTGADANFRYTFFELARE
ncbi:MAG: dihydrofolate reductase [Verrucomicrobia bacterium]|nr:dihydrofolate reductase [Verrucomicrobiota bacterium]